MLAAVLLVAGAAKLVDQTGSRQALSDFGVPAWAIPAAAFGLPVAELLIGVGLLFAATAWVAAVAALVLLGAFTIGIAYQVARGRSPECHCFGALSSSRAGPRTLARNAGLLALAAVVVVGGLDGVAPGPAEWLADGGAAWQLAAILAVAVAAAVARGAWLLNQLLQSQGRLMLRIEALEAFARASTGASQVAVAGPAPTAPEVRVAPPFSLAGVFGETMTLDALEARGRPVLLAFIDPGCGACDELIPDIERWQREGQSLTTVVIGRGGADRMLTKLGGARIQDVLLQEDREVARAYGSLATPSAVLVEQDGTLRTAPAQGVEAIRALVASRGASRDVAGRRPSRLPVLADAGEVPHVHRPPEAASRIGEPARAFALPDLAGGTLALNDLAGDPSVLLFWSPTCGFCQRMVDDVKAFEAAPPAGAPRLVVVATGTRDANAAHGFTSSVLLDAGGEVAASLGARGTPTAVMLDARGRIASPVAAGAPAVLALLNAPG